jgi:3-oxoacyl-[acyl-carrier-protein] synthase-3
VYLEVEKIQEFDQQFIQTMMQTIYRSLEKANISLDQISIILPHNVNYPTWHKIADALRIPHSKIYSNHIQKFGHCLASDGILNLALAQEEGILMKNDYFLMAGCGLGVFFASAVFQC